ncbi:MAG: sigma-54 dependent transcriptional regulator [Tannerella sp.]|jgi:DNA-binding NtrC family response regulator|nr:sigma-54 dependent transcriptional regulator [Tannerella sp.]
MKKGTLVVVDDNKAILTAVEMLLAKYFKKVVPLPSPGLIPHALEEEKPDVVLLDMNFSSGINNGNEGLYWLSEIKRLSPRVQVVLFTAYADISLAVRGMKEGAADFVVKPWDNEQLVETLTGLISSQPLQKKEGLSSSSKKRDAAGEGEMYWGCSEAMRELRTLIEKVSRTEANILITGENGTGKEMLARQIHLLSKRSTAPWVAVDMGAVSETLFESELFGHVKGAFTDARSDRPGKFEAANHGTLFLDEIGNLPYHLQAKLLAVLQNRSLTRVGSNSAIPVDIRLLSATNKNLDEMVAAGSFREDLLYRINTIRVEIPPLRERPEDILPLAGRFLARYAAAYGKDGLSLSDEAAEKLRRHPFPGNIRELQHAVEKAVILAEGSRLEAGHFDLPFPRPTSQKTPSTLEEMEQRMIEQAMEKCKGNLSQVAAQLGISRQTLYNKLKRYGL